MIVSRSGGRGRREVSWIRLTLEVPQPGEDILGGEAVEHDGLVAGGVAADEVHAVAGAV